MISESIKAACRAAGAANTRNSSDPLMRQILFPEEMVEKAYMSLFLSMAYYLKYKVKTAKESELKKYGVYVKSLDQFIFGAYISIIDNDGEDSVTLDFTYNESDFKDMIDAGQAICIDDQSFLPYVSSSTAKVPLSNGTYTSFYVSNDYVHTIYVIAAEVLRDHIESLLDASQNPEDCTVSLEGLFSATGYIDENGNKQIAIEKDELLKQLIKSDDINEVQIAS